METQRRQVKAPLQPTQSPNLRPGRYPSRRRIRARREAALLRLGARYALVNVLLAVAVVTVLFSLYFVEVLGSLWIGGFGVFAACGLMFFANEIERG